MYMCVCCLRIRICAYSVFLGSLLFCWIHSSFPSRSRVTLINENHFRLTTPLPEVNTLPPWLIFHSSWCLCVPFCSPFLFTVLFSHQWQKPIYFLCRSSTICLLTRKVYLASKLLLSHKISNRFHPSLWLIFCIRWCSKLISCLVTRKYFYLIYSFKSISLFLIKRKRTKTEVLKSGILSVFMYQRTSEAKTSPPDDRSRETARRKFFYCLI